MALRFVDGFDYQDFPGADFKYGSFSTFGQGAIQAGRGGTPSTGAGRSLFINNTAFGVYSRYKVLTAGNIWYWGFNFKINGGNGVGTSIFQRWESGASINVLGLDPNSNTQLSLFLVALDQTTAVIKLYTGGTGVNANPGTLIGSPSYVFTKDVWYYIEFAVQFGVHGGITMWVNDAQEYQDLNLNIGFANPDRFTRRWQSFGSEGYTIDDLYIDDSERLGPVRISAHFPSGDGTPKQWTPSAGGPHYPLVYDGTPGYGTVLSAAPDFDATYVQASAAGLTDLYTIGVDPCYGKILGLAANACARKASGSAPSIDLIAKTPDLVIHDLGSGSLPSGSPTPPYFTNQAIVEASLYTGLTWTDRELLNTQWGVRSAGVGSPRVTQFFIEKVVGLRGLPYDCGAQSYAY